MSNKRILVFGKNGQVGGNLVRILSTLPGVDVIATDIDDIDLTKVSEINPFIRSISPEWVINGSAHTAVDRAESEYELSYLLNCEVPGAMADSCSRIGAKFVHYSTDYVFDGEHESPYLESDSPNPRSIYGKSKLAGEQAVLDILPEALVFRTAWVYAKEGKNFVNTMLALAETRTELSVVEDQFGCPTLADDLAAMTVNVLLAIDAGEFDHVGGIFHATGQGQTNWYEFCRAIFKLTNNEHILVRPIKSVDYPTAAPRPKYSVLSNQKLFEKYGQTLNDWHDALNHCLGHDVR